MTAPHLQSLKKEWLSLKHLFFPHFQISCLQISLMLFRNFQRCNERITIGVFACTYIYIHIYIYIMGRNFRSNCRNYRRVLLLFEMDVANPPSPVQIEAIGFSRSKAKNCFYLNEPLESMQKHSFFLSFAYKV